MRCRCEPALAHHRVPRSPESTLRSIGAGTPTEVSCPASAVTSSPAACTDESPTPTSPAMTQSRPATGAPRCSAGRSSRRCVPRPATTTCSRTPRRAGAVSVGPRLRRHRARRRPYMCRTPTRPTMQRSRLALIRSARRPRSWTACVPRWFALRAGCKRILRADRLGATGSPGSAHESLGPCAGHPLARARRPPRRRAARRLPA